MAVGLIGVVGTAKLAIKILGRHLLEGEGLALPYRSKAPRDTRIEVTSNQVQVLTPPMSHRSV